MLTVSGIATKGAAFTGAGAGAGLAPQASGPRAPMLVRVYGVGLFPGAACSPALPEV